MLCKYCEKDLPLKYFQEFKYKGKTYQRKMCSICLSESKRNYYLKKLEEAKNERK